MFTTKDKILIGGGLALAVLLIVVGIFFAPGAKAPTSDTNQQPPPPAITARVISVEPLQDQKGISVAPQINVDLSESVTGKKVELGASSKVKFDAKISKNGDRVTFSPRANLKPKTLYSFQVIVDGDPIFSWNATTKSRGTNQKNLSTVVNKTRSQLPINKDGFGISYDGATDQFFVFIEKAPIEDYKARANKWFRDQGLKDFGALNINYVAAGSLLR